MKIAIVGMGGIGSHLIEHINQLAEYNQFANCEFTAFDNDTVEPKNLMYQRFGDADVGKPKVKAIFDKYLCAPQVIQNNFATPEMLMSYDIAIICVDSGPWRKGFFNKVEGSDLFWIDLRSEGRIIAAYTKHKTNTLEKMNGTISEESKEPGSCQNAFELDKGIIQVGNRIVAAIGVQYLLNYLRKEASAPEFTQRF